MIINLNGKRTQMTVGEKTILCSCVVRNELNGLRNNDEVVLTEPPPGHPYMPRKFPAGTWNVGKPSREPVDPTAYIRVWWIPTDAGQQVRVWNAVENENKMVYTGSQDPAVLAWDSGYGLHCSASPTTLGCIRIAQDSDCDWLALEIIAALGKGEEVTLVADPLEAL